MKLSMKEKKILYAFACPSHHNTVTRLKWLTALTIDPEAKHRMLGLARKMETCRFVKDELQIKEKRKGPVKGRASLKDGWENGCKPVHGRLAEL